ncbi:hypothetical protein [Sphingomicrobium sediminis]|uniref:Uncharacterized protein n=1 Tax=Sphingomicrobium sediminis TaxID=2950949 RepID=A0A9X2EGH6_9SPHN|nr:hypothetical protein [Sphingomicrobium sediminis]MCM8557032.1 hypothetical protein [Sphingomicrobium sediminis]
MIASLIALSLAFQDVTPEAAFVACVAEKDMDAATAIRDADSQDTFEASLMAAFALCPVEVAEFSMKNLFDALAELPTAE